MTRLAGTAGSLVVIGVGIALASMVQSSVPGLVVMFAGVAGLVVTLIRPFGNSGHRKRSRTRPRREADVPRHDPDRAFFDALREVPPRPGAGQR